MGLDGFVFEHETAIPGSDISEGMVDQVVDRGPPGTRLYGQMPERRLPHAGEDQHLDGGPPALAEIVGNQPVGLIDGCDVPRHVVSPLAVFVSLAHL